MENRISLSQLLEVTKKYGPRVTGLFLLTYISVACGAKPNIIFEFTNCGDTRGLELAPGDLIDLTDVGKGIDFQIDENGRVIPPSDKNFGVTKPGQEYWIGNRKKPYYVVTDQGDPNSNGLTDVKIQKVCPVNPTSTPQPSETPTSLLRGTGRLAAQVNRGFHPGPASKPAGRIRI